MTQLTTVNRRDFLRRGASFVALGATVPSFLAHTVYAAGRRGRRLRGTQRILVVVQLAGGNDGLSTIIPVTNDDYYRLRPKLAVAPKGTLTINDDLAFPGSATGLKKLYDGGLVSIIQNVGYPNPNRSHFHSMDIWHTASPDGKQRDGWLGRYFDNQCRGEDSCDPQRGIAVMPETPLAMRGRKFMPLAFSDPTDLSWQAAVPRRTAAQTVEAMNQPQPGDPQQPVTELQYLRRVALKARISSEQIYRATAGRTHNPPTPRARRPRRRGGALAASLDTVANLIGAGIQAGVYYVSHGGYDTHANQSNTHARLMGELGEALSGFMQRLKSQGDLDRVLVMTFSEFGRRVAENASGGTDHGTAAPMMLIGPRVKPGVVGPNPQLTNLDAGDLRYALDFRDVYATVLQDWLDASPQIILNRPAGAIDCIRRG